ncbi:MAG: zeta toxin family protein [Betaproteobacteria bacterium]
MPNVVIIAGPNGAGKSTTAPFLIGKRFGIVEFVNADVIASGLSARAPESVAIEAGRVMLRRLEQLAVQRADFSFETTLASRSFAPWIAKLRRDRGYRFHLIFLWVPDPSQSVARVASRVRAGGHFVPDQVVRRRYERGLANFFSLYSPIADAWEMFDNSDQPRLIAAREAAGPVRFGDANLWEAIRNRMQAREQEGGYTAGDEPKLMGVPASEMELVLREAVRAARRRHKALGESIVIWRDGKVVEVPPEEIEV